VVPAPLSRGRFAKVVAAWQNALEWNANYLENHDSAPVRVALRRRREVLGNPQSCSARCCCRCAARRISIRAGNRHANFDFTSMEQVRDVESHNIYRLAKRLHFPARYRWRMIKTKSRDNARTPMQWDAGENGGFTTGTPGSA
jgi:oligo-1,6-glucosidase